MTRWRPSTSFLISQSLR